MFDAIQSGLTNYGVVPLENSTDGRIVDTLNILARADIEISAEINYAIHHNLIANCHMSDIREIYSKPQALSQCRNWIDINLPHVSVYGASSSTEAAEMIATNGPSATGSGAAAIASTAAAEHFGLRTERTISLALQCSAATVNRRLETTKRYSYLNWTIAQVLWRTSWLFSRRRTSI